MTPNTVVVCFEDLPDLVPDDTHALHVELGDFSNALNTEDTRVLRVFQFFLAEFAQATNELHDCLAVEEIRTMEDLLRFRKK